MVQYVDWMFVSVCSPHSVGHIVLSLQHFLKGETSSLTRYISLRLFDIAIGAHCVASLKALYTIDL